MLEKGYIQIYTGNGKGKTSAALGVSLRMLCAGGKVFFGQFMKGQHYSELNVVDQFENMTMIQFGEPDFIQSSPCGLDIENAKKGLEKMESALSSGEYDIVVFDEINTAMYFGLLSVEQVLETLKTKPEHTEVILTGRYAPEQIIEIADLVTEMGELKHYYTKGVMARKGIEN